MTIIKHRRGSSAEWIAANPVLADGEIGYERDTKKSKVGDGVMTWLELDYFPGGIIETVIIVAASGAAQTIADVVDATIHRITLTANCTFTFPTLEAGKAFTIVLIQDGTGSRLPTWPASVKWSYGTPPLISTGAGKVDYLSFMCTDGTTWAGFMAGQDVR